MFFFSRSKILTTFSQIVPGGQSATSDKWDGPSGVLVCAEDYIIYKHQGAKEHRVPIPKRANPLSDSDRGLIITSAVMHKMRVCHLLYSFFEIRNASDTIKPWFLGCILFLTSKWRRWSL